MGRHDGGRHYVGWRLHREDRARLLAVIPPRYPRILADHVTLRFGVTAHAALPGAREGVAVGLANDGAGVQAVVVEIGGTVRRPDGGTYHITWSLAPESPGPWPRTAARSRVTR